MKKLYCKFALAVLALLPVSFGSASAQQTETLPPAAQQALDKGLAAAKQEQWAVAIQALDQARQLAPKSPVILFNQALAESRVPGRELRSIVLFHAYLAAAPNAANAAAVKDQIGSLQIKVEGTMAGLLDQARDITPKLSSSGVAGLGYSDQLSALMSLVQIKTRVGDTDGAKQIALTCQEEDKPNGVLPYISDCLQDIVQIQAELGDFAGAKATTEQAVQARTTFVMNSDMKQYGQIDQKDIAGAAQNVYWNAYQVIIRDEARAGKIQDAITDLAAHSYLQEVQASSSNPGTDLLVDIGVAQYRAGEKEAAQQTFDRVLSNIAQYTRQGGTMADTDYWNVANAQIQADDLEGALKTMQFVSKTRNVLLLGINDLYRRRLLSAWRSGDLASAKDAVNHLDENGPSIYLYENATLLCSFCKKADLLRLIDQKTDASDLSFSPPAAPKTAIDVWTSLLSNLLYFSPAVMGANPSYKLSDPLFTDFHYQLQVISAQSTPKAIFEGLVDAVSKMANTLEEIKQTDAELAK